MELNGFDASQVEPSKAFEPLPEGEYVAIITESEETRNKAGTGSYLKITLQVIEGPHANRTLFDRLNLSHPKPEVVDIAKRTLSAICHAVGKLTPKRSEDLHNIPLKIKVKCRKRSDNGELANEIRGYSKKDSLGDSQKKAEQSAAGVPPWKQGA